MQTLVIVAHPEFEDSPTQSFLIASAANLQNVQYHVLDQLYPKNQIDVTPERALLLQADQVIFQFPLYWYSAPASLKYWLDQVLQLPYEDAFPTYPGKTLGLVVSTGTAKKQFAAGRPEKFTLSELLRPYEALANKLHMTYRVPLIISQFNYFSEKQKMDLFITYQQYLTIVQDNFAARQQWILQQLQQLQKQQPDNVDLTAVTTTVQANTDQLADLTETLQMMKGKLS